MSPTPSKSANSPSNKNTVDATKPVEPKAAADAKPATEPTAVENQAAPAVTSASAKEETTILSVTASVRTAKSIRLLSKLEAKSISRILLDAIEPELPARLKAALANITGVE